MGTVWQLFNTSVPTKKTLKKYKSQLSSMQEGISLMRPSGARCQGAPRRLQMAGIVYVYEQIEKLNVPSDNFDNNNKNGFRGV